jgi:predicted RNA binding protein YcfA (HicA-like mRNA interferase family)
MTRAPRLKGKEIIRALERAGFQITRTRGSHVFLKHPDVEPQLYRPIPVKSSAPASLVPSFLISE